jgi:glutaredoxin
MKYRLSLVAALVAALTLAGGCSRKTDDGTAPAAQGNLPPLTIRDDTPNLLLTWIDDKGDTHVEMRPADVPAAGKSRVRVVVADREDGTKDLFYVVDLDKKAPDGSYAAETISRRAWEAELEKRRDAYLAKIAPKPAAPRPNGEGAPNGGPAAGASAGALTVTIYGASWCGPCHQAEAYLKSKGVAVVMKDIESTPGAAAEMRDKLEKSGQRGGSIPVIDVRGQVLVGFSASALDRAMARARGSTML